MSQHCMLLLNGVLAPKDIIPVAAAIATNRPYAMDWSPDTIQVAKRLETEGWWEFPGIPDGKIPDAILKALTDANIGYAWVHSEYGEDFITLTQGEDVNSFVYGHESICLKTDELTQDRIAEANAWEAWLKSAQLILAETAHDYFEKYNAAS